MGRQARYARRVRPFAIAVMLAAIATGVEAQDEPSDPRPEQAGHHCLDEQESKWVLHHLLAGQYNPPGAETSERLGLCFPLITAPGVLFAYTSVEVGILNYLSPAYGQLGGYVQVTPLSIIQLRAELSGLYYWPFPFDRAGYFPVAGYDAEFTREALPKDDAQSAPGWNVNLIGVLRLRVPLSEAWAALVLSIWSAEYFSIGDASHYFNLRRELVAAQRDWIVANESVAAAEVAVSPEWRFRFGIFDSWRAVPAAGYAANQVGLFLGAHWPRPTGLLESMRDLQPFLRLGIYTAHGFRRSQISILLAVLSSYDLGGL